MQSPCELSPRFQIIFLFAVCFTAIALVMTAYDGYDSRRLSTSHSIQEVDQTLKRVAKHMRLPPKEIPTIATVADMEPLRGSPLFEKAELGDKLVIYVRAGLVILYSPKYDRVVQVAPIYFGAGSSSQP